MRVEHDHPVFGTVMVLSRRNLLSLLAKLDGNPPDSECMIGAPIAYGLFHVRAEEDDVHYNHPDRLRDVGDNRAGPMHPDTEALLASGVEVAPFTEDQLAALDAQAEDQRIEAARLR